MLSVGVCLAAAGHRTSSRIASVYTSRNIKWMWHRAGILVGLIQYLRCIDPFSVYGIFPYFVRSLISNTVTCALAIFTIAAFWTTIVVSYQLVRSKPPAFVKPLLLFVVVITVLWSYLSVIITRVGVTEDQFLSGGLYLLWLALGITIILIVFDVGVWPLSAVYGQIISQQKASQSSSELALMASPSPASSTVALPIDPSVPDLAGKDSTNTAPEPSVSKQQQQPSLTDSAPPVPPASSGPKFMGSGGAKAVRDALRRLRVFQLVTHLLYIAVFTGQLVVALNSRGKTVSEDESKVDDFEFSKVGFWFAQFLLTCVFVWFSWMPPPATEETEINSGHVKRSGSVSKKNNSQLQYQVYNFDGTRKAAYSVSVSTSPVHAAAAGGASDVIAAGTHTVAPARLSMISVQSTEGDDSNAIDDVER